MPQESGTAAGPVKGSGGHALAYLEDPRTDVSRKWLITIHDLVFGPLRIGLGLFQIPTGLNLWLIHWDDPNHL